MVVDHKRRWCWCLLCSVTAMVLVPLVFRHGALNEQCYWCKGHVGTPQSPFTLDALPTSCPPPLHTRQVGLIDDAQADRPDGMADREGRRPQGQIPLRKLVVTMGPMEDARRDEGSGDEDEGQQQSRHEAKEEARELVAALETMLVDLGEVSR